MCCCSIFQSTKTIHLLLFKYFNNLSAKMINQQYSNEFKILRIFEIIVNTKVVLEISFTFFYPI